MIYYKVVRKDCNNNLCSVMGRNEISVIYFINKWVKPNIIGSDLMIFNSLDNAKKCIRDNGWDGTHIFTCRARNVSKSGIFFEYMFCIDILKEMAKLKKNKKKYTHLYPTYDTRKAPSGTLFASEVMLLEEVR